MDLDWTYACVKSSSFGFFSKVSFREKKKAIPGRSSGTGVLHTNTNYANAHEEKITK